MVIFQFISLSLLFSGQTIIDRDCFEKFLSFQLFSFKGLAFVEEFTVDEPLDNEEDEENVIVDEPLDSDPEKDEENGNVDEPLDNDLEQDDHDEEYYDLDQDNDNEKIVVKDDQDDFEDCEENVIEENHHDSEFEVIKCGKFSALKSVLHLQFPIDGVVLTVWMIFFLLKKACRV